MFRASRFSTAVQHVRSSTGNLLAYEQFPGSRRPGVVFFPGYKSFMHGKKAQALWDYCQRTDRQFTRFDYSGVGMSAGKFEDGCLSVWLKDVLSILDCVVPDGKLVLVGSSMGGQLMTLAALSRPERLHGLLGIATAVDYVPVLINKLTPKQKEILERDGRIQFPSLYSGKPYVHTKRFSDDGMREENRVTLSSCLDITCPVRLVHGRQDVDVEWQRTEELATRLKKCVDLKVTYVPDGDHILSRKEDWDLIWKLLNELIDR